jgi:hypothetical protein
MPVSPKSPWQFTWYPLLLSTAAAGVLLCGAPASRRPPPQCVADVVDRLREGGMRVHVVPTVSFDTLPNNSAFLCMHPRTPADLAGLCRLGARASAWVDVIQVERCPNEATAAGNLPDWGRHGARVGGVLLFGDADMVRRVVKVLED